MEILLTLILNESKKRSSFSEAEGANGPNMQRLIYQQFYQRQDPLFRDPRNVPPEEEEESSEGSIEQKNARNQHQKTDRKLDSPTVPKSPPKRSNDKNIDRTDGIDDDRRGENDRGHEIPRISPSKQRNLRVKGILKPKNAPTNTKRRVQFDPLALLLDASLEGEIELVKRVIDKVFHYQNQTIRSQYGSNEYLGT